MIAMLQHLKENGKRLLCLLCMLLLGSCLLWSMPVSAAKADTTASATQTTEAADTDEDSDNKTGQIVLVLVIFTVTCGVTAYVVAHPSLKKLKAARAAQKEEEK